MASDPVVKQAGCAIKQHNPLEQCGGFLSSAFFMSRFVSFGSILVSIPIKDKVYNIRTVG